MGFYPSSLAATRRSLVPKIDPRKWPPSQQIAWARTGPQLDGGDGPWYRRTMSDRKDPSQRSPGALTYRSAGVDIDAGSEVVDRIRALVNRTRRPEQIDQLGGFAGMIGLPEEVEQPALVSCTDGVGTKLLVAIAMDRHDTIGIDAVAMNVNDLICTGAKPLFVLDYIACGKLVPATIERIVAGIVAGCTEAGCALLGGETAELPGLYQADHYDLAAFAVGVVDKRSTLGPHRVRAGDVVLGLPSCGLHSNGYSLARKALLDPAHRGLDLNAALPEGDGTVTVGEALLVPTRIYASALARLGSLPEAPLHAAAHITGGGLIDNPPRALPSHLAMELDLREVSRPPIFRAVAAAGVNETELLRTFNCGLGMVLVVDPDHADNICCVLTSAGEPVLAVGRVVPRAGNANAVKFLG